MIKKKIALIGAQLGWGAQIHETEWGPCALVQYGLENILCQSGMDIYWRAQVKPQMSYQKNDASMDWREVVDVIMAFNQDLAEVVVDSLSEHEFPVVIGGDHAIAMGTWSAVVDSFNAYDDFGLIWIDAHLDAHIPQTSPSQAIHGMPVAHLLGFGEKKLNRFLHSTRKINPKYLIYIGTRSFEPEEYELIQELGIKVYDMSCVNEKGFAQVLADSLAFLNKNVSHLGISFDLDAFDPEVAPGVGSPEKNGLMPKEVLAGLHGVGHHPKMRAFEIVEFNPHLDKEEKTVHLIQDLLLSFFRE